MTTLEKLLILENEAAEFGFKWENPEQIIVQIQNEVAEIEVHLQDHDQAKLQEEIGDLLHAAFSLCVFCHFNPNEMLTKSIDKFEKRFRSIQNLAKAEGLSTLNGQSFEKLMALWDKAKQLTKSGS
ncbi:MAG: MazG nucleotide pyrophosphohydrolase domain-containing protein [Gammaproteobacteria bacterium]